MTKTSPFHLFQVLRVTILGVDNSIPDVEVGGPMLVAEGGSVVVPASSIIALDLDTLPSKLEVVLDSQPIFGYLTNKAGKLSHQPSYSVCIRPLEGDIKMRRV